MKKSYQQIISIFISVIFILSAFPFVIYAADETTIAKNGKAQIDYTDVNKTGTIKIKALVATDKRMKVKIEQGKANYTYDLKNDKTEEIFPLQLGNGNYKIKVLTNVGGTKYSTTLVADITLKLENELAPYTNANQFVNYNKDSKTVKKAKELTKDCKTDMEKVQAVYKYIIANLTYDDAKAKQAKNGEISGYVPSIDMILTSKKGICFDYAAIFAAMLRSQGIPAKLVMGYVAPNNIYHAWNEFYIKGTGWFKINEMKFNEGEFERVDATMDSTGKSSKQAMEYIGNGSNYEKTKEY